MIKNIFYLLFIFNCTFSQNFNEEFKLTDVRVEGNTLTSKNTIIFTSGLHKGELVKLTEFPRAIKKLWQLGLFQDIQIFYDEQDVDGISIIIYVKENFVLGELEYVGNKKVKDKKLTEEVKYTKGQRIKPKTIKNISNQIEKFYKEKGYLNVSIKSNLIEPSSVEEKSGEKCIEI